MAAYDQTGSAPDPPLPLIRASELGQYSFCHRAWWLSNVKGLPSANQSSLNRGQQIHAQHARRVRAASYWHRAGLFFVGSGGLLLLLAGLWFWLF
jgi:hypothetical protein